MKKIYIFKSLSLAFALLAFILLFIPSDAKIELFGEGVSLGKYMLIDYDIGFLTMILFVPYAVFEIMTFFKTKFQNKALTVLAKSFLLGFALFILITAINDLDGFGGTVGVVELLLTIPLFTFGGIALGIELKYLKNE